MKKNQKPVCKNPGCCIGECPQDETTQEIRMAKLFNGTENENLMPVPCFKNPKKYIVRDISNEPIDSSRLENIDGKTQWTSTAVKNRENYINLVLTNCCKTR